jgi:hypothetical protein
VVFDEFVFPFSTLHSNTGAWLHSEISLLPSSLLESTSYGASSVDHGRMPKSTNPPLQLCDEQAPTQEPLAVDHSVLSPGDPYFFAHVADDFPSDPGAAMDPGA